MTNLNYPKTAWYEGREAKQVADNVYYVWRGEWSDPCYVLADEAYTVPVFGSHIKGTEVNYFDVWGGFEEDYEPSTDEIVEAVEEVAASIAA